MINFWKLSYKTVKEQRDELQLQNIGLKKELNYRNKSYTELFEAYEKSERENDTYHMMLAEADDKIEELRERIIELEKWGGY